MRKTVYLCLMMTLSLNMLAQIDLNDKNWDTLFIEDFSGIRGWDGHWEDSTGTPGYKPLWRCFCYNLWNSGVTKYSGKYPNYAAYQPSNAVFDPDNGTMRLIGEFKTEKNMTCDRNTISDTTYRPAPWRKYCHDCDLAPNPKLKIHYLTGMIESTDSMGYGYYEIRCKMPVHPGSHDAFWFWGAYGKYEEIDVFEHGITVGEGDTIRRFNSGIYYNPDGTNYLDDTVAGVVVHGAYNYAPLPYHIPKTNSALDEYHTYGCLWLPERVAWYFDGELFNEETDPSHIPQHPMWLKITHHEDSGANKGTEEAPDWWKGSDEMTVDYVKALRLETDCASDALVRDTAAFNGFNYAVKRSITMGGASTPLVIPDSTSFTMRAVEHITIDHALEVPLGSSMTLITQSCPECSQEGVHSQNYCPR